MGNWDLHQIEQAFAKAAIDCSAWNDALETVTDQTGSLGTVLLHPEGISLPIVPMTERLQECTDTYFKNGWHLRDERNRGAPLLRRYGVIDDLDILPVSDIKRHPYYQEFLAPFGISAFAGVKIAFEDNLWCLSIQRSAFDGPFSYEEKQRLAGLSRALSTSAAVSHALGFAASSAALEAFEISGSAVLLLDKRGEVVMANPSAERLLGNGVRIVRRRLVAADATATAALDQALHKLLWSPSGAALLPPVVLSREARSPLLAYPLKLSNWTDNPFSDGRAMVVLIDPDMRRRPPEDALRSGFGLTVAEARLAARLAASEDLSAISDDLGITKETARHHLKNVFAKTGVRRQAELVALFAGMLARTG